MTLWMLLCQFESLLEKFRRAHISLLLIDLGRVILWLIFKLGIEFRAKHSDLVLLLIGHIGKQYLVWRIFSFVVWKLCEVANLNFQTCLISVSSGLLLFVKVIALVYPGFDKYPIQRSIMCLVSPKMWEQESIDYLVVSEEVCLLENFQELK